MRTISAEKLQQQIASGNPVRLLDVRTPAEYASGHIAQAALAPLERLDAARLSRDKENVASPVHVICQSGARASNAIKKLEAAGLCDCVLVEGGMSAWTKAGFAVEGKRGGVISLERQVRIAAGSLVLVGTLLSAFVHSGWLVVPGFVGAGLVFAGISDFCGMGMLLARMPWNRGSRSTGHARCCEVKI